MKRLKFDNLMSFFSQKKIGIMISVLTFLLLAIFIGLTGIYIYLDYHTTIQKEKGRLENYSGMIARQMESILNESSALLKATDTWLVNNPDKDPRTDVNYTTIIKTICKETASFVDIRFVSDEGHLFYMGDSPDAPRNNVKDREYYTVQLDDKTKGLHVAGPVKSRVTNLWEIPMSYPLSENKHKLKLVFAAIELPLIVEEWSKSLPAQSSIIALLRKDGVILALYPFKDYRMGVSIADNTTWKSIISETNSGSIMVKNPSILKEQRLIAWKNMDKYSLVVLTSTSLREVLERWQINMIITSCIVFALGGALLLLVLRIYILLNRLQINESGLKVLNSMKDKFFSIISHDLRSHISTQMNFIQLLKERNMTYSAGEREKAINYMASNSDKTMKLLNNLLTWAKSQMGHLTPQITTFNLKTLSDEEVRLASESAAAKEITLINTITESQKMSADSNMISTVIRNLLINAIKYTKHGGQITIGSTHSSGMISIIIQDNGIGMDEELQSKLFKIGENVARPGTNHEKGSGIGLLLCAEFIEKHRGFLTVKSIPDKGTTITFSIPQNS